MADRLFPALCKFWRQRRGLSQLDLALAARVSGRHVSFLESGRAQPSEGMVLRLLTALEVPLRDQNEVLRAAGFAPRFSDAPLGEISAAVDDAIARMLEQQEPYPLLVLTPDYQVVRANRAASLVFSAFVAEPERLRAPIDMISMIFDPAMLRGAIVDWEQIARLMLSRLHRESLAGRTHAAALIDRAFAFPDVPRAWVQPDFTRPAAPAFSFRMRRGRLEVGFLNTITVFSAPQQVTLQELVIESSYPLDAATRAVCLKLARKR